MAIKPVKFYSNLFEGAPQINNQNGDLTAMLDTVLVTGFNTKTVTSITVASGVATVTFPAPHNFFINQVIEIAGCNEAVFNGQFSVVSRTTNTLTFEVSGAPAAATGVSITCKTPPLGFEIAFTGTNKRAYRSKNINSSRIYLRVDDGLDPLYNAAYAKKGKVMMAEEMTDIDTFPAATAPYSAGNPGAAYQTTGSGVNVYDGWYKWYYHKRVNPDGNSSLYYFKDIHNAPAGNKNWVLIGDDRGFYFFIEPHIGNGRVGHCFTDFESFRAGDAYNTILCATDNYTPADPGNDGGSVVMADYRTDFTKSLNANGKVIMKDYQQVGANVNAGFMSLNTNNSQTVSGYTTGVPWPNGPDYGLVVFPVYLKQSNNHIRGKMPGMMWVHNDSPMQHWEFVDGVMGFPGRKFLMVTASNFVNSSTNSVNNGARLLFDITGPWW